MAFSQRTEPAGPDRGARSLPGWPRVVRELPCLDNPTRDAFRAYREETCGQAVRIRTDRDPRGGAAQWDADYLRQRAGSRHVQVFVSADGCFTGGKGPFDPAWLQVKLFSVAECLDRMKGIGEPVICAGERYYMYQNARVWWDDLMAEVPRPSYVPRLAGEHIDSFLWIGTGGSTTLAHFDPSENLILQIKGRKRILLWDIGQMDRLALIPEGEPAGRQSRIRLDRPDPIQFPRFVDADAWWCELLPGEMLYIPLGWVHDVETLEFSISVNYWWNIVDFMRPRTNDSKTDLSPQIQGCPAFRFGPNFCRCWLQQSFISPQEDRTREPP